MFSKKQTQGKKASPLKKNVGGKPQKPVQPQKPAPPVIVRPPMEKPREIIREVIADEVQPQVIITPTVVMATTPTITPMVMETSGSPVIMTTPAPYGTITSAYPMTLELTSSPF